MERALDLSARLSPSGQSQDFTAPRASPERHMLSRAGCGAHGCLSLSPLSLYSREGSLVGRRLPELNGVEY